MENAIEKQTLVCNALESGCRVKNARWTCWFWSRLLFSHLFLFIFLFSFTRNHDVYIYIWDCEMCTVQVVMVHRRYLMSMFTRSKMWLDCFPDDKLNCNSNWFNANNHRTRSCCFSFACVFSFLFHSRFERWQHNQIFAFKT